jgi:hypothetical protein
MTNTKSPKIVVYIFIIHIEFKKNQIKKNSDIKQKIDKLHKFEAKDKTLKSPKKPLLKSKEEGIILGLPQEKDKEPENEDEQEDEPSIYFFEDDEEELEILTRKCLPILSEMNKQISNFDLYNDLKNFKKEHQYEPTIIMDNKDLKRSSIGVYKTGRKSSNKHGQDKNVDSAHKDYSIGLSKMQETVTSLLGVKRYEDWILNLNIGNVMHLSPLNLQEMNLQLDNSHELTRDALLEKIVLLSISYF